MDEACVNVFVGGRASFFHVIWTTEKVRDCRSAATGDRVISRYFSIDLMNRGIFLLGHPNVSAATSEADISFTLGAVRESIVAIRHIIRVRSPDLLI